VPPRGWKTATLREETLQRLRRLQEEEKLPTLDDTVRLLLDRAQLCSGIEPRLRKIELLLARLIEELTGRTTEGPETRGPQGPRGRDEVPSPGRPPRSADKLGSVPSPARPGGPGREPRENIE